MMKTHFLAIAFFILTGCTAQPKITHYANINKEEWKKATDTLKREVKADLLTVFTKQLNDSLNKLPSIATGIRPTGVVDSVNKVFYVDGPVILGTVEVRIYDGKYWQELGEDWYTIYGNGRLVFKEAPLIRPKVNYLRQ